MRRSCTPRSTFLANGADNCMDTLHYAFYADDFTGATDTLATLARGGLRALLFLGVPDAGRLGAAGALDALGIAGAARSMAPPAMRRELKPVARFFAELTAPVLHYKCCSTFDSAPGIGSLGVALEVLRRALPSAGLVPIIGGQPSLGRYCVFGHLFASAGSGGEVYRIDRHPTMSRHPVTPMTESDLLRHLAAQGMRHMAQIDWRALERPDALEQALERISANSPDAVLFDALNPEHLARIGAALWPRALHQRMWVMGASSVAQAFLAHWQAQGQCVGQASPPLASANGPVFVLSGSQSPVSRAQCLHAQQSGAYRCVEMAADGLVEDAQRSSYVSACVAQLQAGQSVLAHTGVGGAGGPSTDAVAQGAARLMAEVLRQVPMVRRVGVAGGDTSSYAVQALGVWGLGYAATLAQGVQVVRARSNDLRLDGLELMLKGGQMGPVTLFEDLINGCVSNG